MHGLGTALQTLSRRWAHVPDEVWERPLKKTPSYQPASNTILYRPRARLLLLPMLRCIATGNFLKLTLTRNLHTKYKPRESMCCLINPGPRVSCSIRKSAQMCRMAIIGSTPSPRCSWYTYGTPGRPTEKVTNFAFCTIHSGNTSICQLFFKIQEGSYIGY